jgi:hypothetical protein
LVDYVKVVEIAPEVLKNVKSQKRTADGDLPEDIQFVRDLLASPSGASLATGNWRSV